MFICLNNLGCSLFITLHKNTRSRQHCARQSKYRFCSNALLRLPCLFVLFLPVYVWRENQHSVARIGDCHSFADSWSFVSINNIGKPLSCVIWLLMIAPQTQLAGCYNSTSGGSYTISLLNVHISIPDKLICNAVPKVSAVSTVNGTWYGCRHATARHVLLCSCGGIQHACNDAICSVLGVH